MVNEGKEWFIDDDFVDKLELELLVGGKSGKEGSSKCQLGCKGKNEQLIKCGHT